MAQIDKMDAYEFHGIKPPKNSRYDPNDAFDIHGLQPPSKEQNMPVKSQEMGLGQKIMQALMNAPAQGLNAVKGASDALVNLPAQAVNLALPQGNKLPLFQSGEGTAYDVGKFGGELGSWALGGGALNAIRKGAEMAPVIGNAAKWLGGSGIKGVSRRALGNAAYGATQADPDEVLESAGIGGLSSAFIDSLLGGLGKLKPSSFLRGNLSPEELMKNLEASRGTRTDLGNIVNKPGLKKTYENFLSKIPLSGVESYMGSVASDVNKQGSEILQDILGNQNPEGLKKAIQEGLKKSYRGVLSKKNKLWDETNTIADELGVEVGRENLAREAKSILGEIKQSKELERKIPAHIKEDLREYSDESNINTLRLSNIFKGALGTEASKLFKESGKSFEYGIYKKLQDALKRDIEGSIEGSSSPALREKYDSAMKFHKDEVAPFEEREIAKFTRKGGDPDLILSSFIKKGQNDRSELLSKLLNKLPEEQKGLVGYGYLSKALGEGKLNPSKLRSIYESLGTNQKNILFDKGMKDRLDRYSKLTQMNTEALTSMVNPKTGSRLLDLLPMIMGIAGGSYGASHAGVPGSAGGALAGIMATGLGAKGASKYLTSPKIREKIVNKMINQKDKSTEADILRGMVQVFMNK